MNNDIKPWEQPRIKRVIELFGGKVIAVKTIRRTADGKNELRR